MRAGFVPDRGLLWVLVTLAAAAAAALAAGVPAPMLRTPALLLCAALSGALLLDWLLTLRAWRAQPALLQRRLPQALAIGVPARVELRLRSGGDHAWRLQLFDQAEAPLRMQSMPQALTLGPGQECECGYEVLATARGTACWQPARARVHSLWRTGWLCVRLGVQEQRRVLPDFAQTTRYAWLADQRRLGEIGVRQRQRRGEGTEFRQLGEYHPGDAIRHIDWRATLRQSRPIVRQFQEERDQQVLLLLDCGRRMRAAEGDAIGGHFDHVLNALVLLACVALRHGDAVGALSFGLAPLAERWVAPSKGAAALHRLVRALYDVQPTLAQPDLLSAAAQLMARQRRRALVIVVTSFRVDDDGEVRSALQLMGSRHLVMFASVRELALQAALTQPLRPPGAPLEVAAAHRHAQALARLAGLAALHVDAEPAQLGAALVNRYEAAKRAGLL